MKTTAFLILTIGLLLSSGDKDILSSKSIEKRLVQFSPGLYANKYETTNSEYRRFLEWIEANTPDQLENLKVKQKGWEPITDSRMVHYYSDHTAFDEYPVVNISYENVLRFCEWLTDTYHEDAKRKYNKVVFRLPSAEEWLVMARGDRTHPMAYPWGGPYLKNRKGQYLANFYPINNHRVKVNINNRKEIEVLPEPGRNMLSGGDTYPLTAPVHSFVPTGHGFHNLSGNVAEMLAEKGHTKGGSWGSSGYYLRLDAEDEFEGFNFSPYIGFRYVMEVLEE